MPSFLNAIRKLPGLMDPERLMKTPSFAGDVPKPVAIPAMQPTATPPKPVAMPAPVHPNISAPMSLPTPDLTPEPAPVAPHPGYGRMKDFYRRGDGPIDRQAISGLEDQYMQEHGQKRGWKDTLANVLSGAAQGMATTGDWGGALGGAVAGGTGTLVSPKAGARFGFNTRERPELEGLYGQQQQERQQTLAERLKQQQILNQQAQQEYNQARAQKALQPEAPKPFQRNPANDFYMIGPDGKPTLKEAGKAKPEQQRMGWVTQPDGSKKWSALTPDTVSSPDPAMGLDLWAKREGILGQLRRDQQDRQEFPLRMQKLQKDLNEPPSGSQSKGLTPQQRASYFGEMNDAITAFKEMMPATNGKNADDPGLAEAARQLQARFGEDIEVGIGDGGYPYAKPRMIQIGDPKEQNYMTVREIREQLRSLGKTDAEITAELRKRQIIK